MEELILDKARTLFFHYGVKSISMDDLAREAGVSKKTLYQVVADKNELVLKVVEGLLSCFAEGLEHCSNKARNAVEEVVLQTKMPFAELAAINPSFFYDLEKFFPEAWQLITRHREKGLLPQIRRNLERGITEGLYRDDTDLALTPQIRLQQLQSAVYPCSLKAVQPSLPQLMNRLTRFYLQAVTSGKGNRMIDKYLNENSLIKEDR